MAAKPALTTCLSKLSTSITPITIIPNRVFSQRLTKPPPHPSQTLLSLLPRRFAHSIPRPPAKPASTAPSSLTETQSPPKEQQPSYELTFTCVPCSTRSRHRVSKHGYHHGSVLIACPGCKNRHVISDHLKIFGDRKITIEDILREKGLLVKKGIVGGTEEGDLEFWDDGTETVRGEDKEEVVEYKKQEGVDVDAPPGGSFKVAGKSGGTNGTEQ
ncbi:DNL zinc finger-domain-containing protein [Cladorrhinum sp. PSN259]|nr:DNL zinc finger-domain-containing protein [Cladorrhinum sp. PSN259]